jgi:hypothetical protein
MKLHITIVASNWTKGSQKNGKIKEKAIAVKEG